MEMLNNLRPGSLPSDSTFNHDAARENAENKKHIKLTHGGGITTITIGPRATYNGIPALLLSDFNKRKLENRVLFTFLHELKQIPLIKYA